MAKTLFDGRGNPLKSSPVVDTAWQALQALGVEQREDGGMVISPEAMRRIRTERMRRVAVTSVPSTKRHLQRDAGGIGVPKQVDMAGGVTLRALRRFRERSPIVQAIHSARAYQVRRLARKWDGQETSVGWRVGHKDLKQPGKQQPKDIGPFIDRFERMIERPAPSYDQNSTGTLMALIMEDLLTINRPVVEVIHSLYDPGRVVQFKAVDGELIWPTLAWLEKWQADNPGWARGYGMLTQADELEIASAALQWDLTGAKYCIVRDGILEGVANPDRLLVGPIQNRTAIETAGYWPSHVEQAKDLILAFIRTFDYNANYFTRGMLAEFAIMVAGDIHPQDADAFYDQLREGTQGTDHAWEPPLIQVPSEGDVKTLPLKESNREMMFEVWSVVLMSLTTAIYRMHMSTVNAKGWDAGGGNLSEPSQDREINLSQEEGLQGDIGHLTDEILNPLAMRCHPDLRVFWEWGNVDPKAKAELYDARTNVDLSPNDVRVAEGKIARGYYLTDEEYASLDPDDPKRAKHDQNPWNWPKAGAIATTMQQQAQQQAQQDMLQAQQDAQPSPAQPNGWEEGGDDGDGYGGPEDEDDGYGNPSPPKPFGAPPGQGAQQPPPPGPPPPAAMQKGRRRRRRPITVIVYDAGDDE